MRKVISPEIKGTSVGLKDLLRLRYVAKTLPLLKQKKIVSAQFGGHLSKLRGRGIEFSEIRAYHKGDDVRRMNWRLTAKTGKPHVKEYYDEKERPIYLLIDQRQNMFFGTKVAFKSVIASQIAAILSWVTIENGDKLGAIIYQGKSLKEFRPKARNKTLLPLLKELANTNCSDGHGSLSIALLQLRHVVKPGSLIFIISDYSDLGDDFALQLAQLKQHNEIVGCFVYDILEKKPPKLGLYAVTNGREWFEMNTHDVVFCEKYIKFFQDRHDQIEQIFSKWNIPWIEFGTHDRVDDKMRLVFKGLFKK